jgi:hypothetical protein
MIKILSLGNVDLRMLFTIAIYFRNAENMSNLYLFRLINREIP